MYRKITDKLNEKGYSLVELLAVIVILGIILSIAVPSIASVISSSRDKAFVANAISIRDAANLYVKEQVIKGNNLITKITYRNLYDLNYLEEIMDPYTGNYLAPSDKSYALVSGEKITAICFYGEDRNLCTNSGINTPIPVDEITIEHITNN